LELLIHPIPKPKPPFGDISNTDQINKIQLIISNAVNTIFIMRIYKK
jgi:hypothetical protein